jgi:hypothetical protein
MICSAAATGVSPDWYFTEDGADAYLGRQCRSGGEWFADENVAQGSATAAYIVMPQGRCVLQRCQSLFTTGSQIRVSLGELHFFRELQPTQRLTLNAVAVVAPAFVVYPYGVKGLATIPPSTAALSVRGGFGSGTDPNPMVAIAPRTEPSETLRLSTQRWGIVVNRPGALWLIGRVGSETRPGACGKVPYSPFGSGVGERAGRKKRPSWASSWLATRGQTFAFTPRESTARVIYIGTECGNLGS